MQFPGASPPDAEKLSGTSKVVDNSEVSRMAGPNSCFRRFMKAKLMSYSLFRRLALRLLPCGVKTRTVGKETTCKLAAQMPPVYA